jgi:hypothetical protein
VPDTAAAAPTTTVSAPTGPISDDAAASRFESLWDAGAFDGPTQGNPEPAKAAAQPPPKQAEPPKQEGPTRQEAEPTQQAEPTQVEGADQPETAESAEPLEALDGEDFAARPVTVKIDGKESQVTLSELVKGYQISSAAQSRLEQAQRARDAFQSEQTQVRQALGVRIQQIEGLLTDVQQAILGENPVNNLQLRAENPGEWSARVTDYNQRQAWLQTRLQQVGQARQEQEQVANQQRQQALPQELQRLTAAMPEWQDAAKLREAQQQMRAYGQRRGFTDQELNGVYDHRYMLALDDASQMSAAQQAATQALGRTISTREIVKLVTQYAKTEAARPEVTKRVTQAPKMTAPGTRTPPKDPNTARLTSAKDAFRKTRSDDAAAAILEMIG